MIKFPELADRSLITDLVQVVHRRSVTIPDKRALVFLTDGETEEISLSFGELDYRARAIAAELQRRGLSGKRALLLYPPGLDFVAGLFGCFYAGVVAVPLYPPRRNRNVERIRSIALDAEPTAALTVHEVAGGLDRLAQLSPELARMQWVTTDNIPDESALSWQPPSIQPDSLAILQYTSGSTGSPKGVMLSHQNVLSNCRMITEAFNIMPDDVGLSWLPAYHDMGLVGGIINPLYAGDLTILMSPMAFLHKPARWLRGISNYGVTVSGGPNFAYDICTKKITAEEMAGLDLSCWRLAYNGAETIRASTLRRFHEKFRSIGFHMASFYPCYGMAESTLLVTGGDRNHPPVTKMFDGNHLDAGFVREASSPNDERILVGSGRPLPGEIVNVVDPRTSERLEPGRIGEIWVAGPSVGNGYFGKSELTDATFNARLANDDRNYLRTGDLGFFADGQLFVTGRIKDLIIIRGVNHYPQDIEQTVEQADPRLRTGAAAAFSLAVDGVEELIVVSEVERLRNQDWQPVIQAIRRRVAEVHDVHPDGVILIRTGSIPKTSSGKIQRHACRQGFLNNDLMVVAEWCQWQSGTEVAAPPRQHSRSPNETPPTAPATTPVADPLPLVLAAVTAVAGDRAVDIHAGTNIFELGLDSLERIDVASRVEKDCGVVFPEQALLDIQTCDDLAALVKQLQTSESSVDPADYPIAASVEYQQLQRMITTLASEQIENPYFRVHEGVTNDTTIIDGRQLVNFSSYNYLGLSGDADVNRAAQQAIEQYGTSVSASRIASGEKPIHRELEVAIAQLLGVQDAIVFVGGHATNETTIGHLLGPSDLVLHDELAHNSILQGCLLSGATRRSFAHNDWRDLEQLLTASRDRHRRVLIAIEGAYSMDGDYPDLPKFIAVKQRHRALLMVDEAHSIGTMGPTGRGIAEHFGIDPSDVDIWMGTLSKAFASCGGYIAADAETVQYLRYTAPGFVFSVGMPPASAGAALAAIQNYSAIRRERAAVRLEPTSSCGWRNCHGLNTGGSHHTPIVPVIVGSSRKALQLVPAPLRARNQRPADSLSSRRRRSCPPAILHHLRSH